MADCRAGRLKTIPNCRVVWQPDHVGRLVLDCLGNVEGDLDNIAWGCTEDRSCSMRQGKCMQHD